MEEYSDILLRIDKNPMKEINQIARNLNLEIPENFKIPWKSKVVTKKHSPFTWKELSEIDKGMTIKIKEMAKRYGYR